MDRIDSDTADQVRRILILCRTRGQDPVTVLDKAGLLRHPTKIQSDRLATVEHMIDVAQLSVVSVIKFWEVPRTVLDLKYSIIRYLEHWKDKLNERTDPKNT
jgi:restriction endonuclease Mrr